MVRIAIGADHRGFKHKQLIIDYFSMHTDEHILLVDMGTDSTERTDFPIFTDRVVTALKKGDADQGILLCGSGIGMAIAANRHTGIYAGVAWSPEVAQKAKEHDNLNILVLPSDYVHADQLIPIIKAWLAAQFLAGRYLDRLQMLDQPVDE